MVQPYTIVVGDINEAFSIAADIVSIYDRITRLVPKWSEDGVAAVTAAMNTSAVGADGVIGAQDATPVSTHPILPTSYPPLSRPISSFQVGQLFGELVIIKNVIDGQAVGTNPAMHAIFDYAVGG